MKLMLLLQQINVSYFLLNANYAPAFMPSSSRYAQLHFTKSRILCKLLAMVMRNIRRHSILSKSILLLILFLLFYPADAAAQDPPPGDTPLPFDPRFGIADSFVNTSEANVAGAGWTRVFFRWDVVQPAGSFDWKPANVPDPLINAEVAAGREVVAVLIGTPAWAGESGTSTAVPPLEAWGNFVFNIATQYKGRIKHWVIWNQPDITDPASPSHTWAGTEEDYYRLLKEAYLKIKAVDPAMQVHLAGLTYTWDQEQGNSQYLARLLNVITTDPQAAEENQFFDAVTYHLYYDPVQILRTITDIRTILDANGQGHKPIWINEINAPPSEDFIEPPTAPVAFRVSLDEQSAFVIQAFALALASGAERIAFNKMRNERDHPESAVPYGLLRGDNSRRPAFDAFRTVSTYFAGVQQSSWIQLGNIYIVTLNRGEQTTTILWNTAPTPATYSLNAIAPEALLVDERSNIQTITAANGVYPLDLPGATCTNGDYCFIGGAPRLVVETGSSDQRAPLVPPTPTLVPLPTETPGPTPVPPTPALLPTITTTPIAIQSTPATEATEDVSTVAEENPPPADVLPDPGVGEAPPPAGALPDPEFDPSAPITEQTADVSVTSTIIPPVSIGTILRPDRILWLFIIGLVVFTVSYGIQVAIWYRTKR